jgi:hypothetical protein
MWKDKSGITSLRLCFPQDQLKRSHCATRLCPCGFRFRRIVAMHEASPSRPFEPLGVRGPVLLPPPAGRTAEPCGSLATREIIAEDIAAGWRLGLFVALYARGVRTENFVSFVSRLGSGVVVLDAALAQAGKASVACGTTMRDVAWRAAK